MLEVKINSLKREISKSFRKNPVLSRTILLLIVLMFIQFLYFYSENQRLKNELLSTNTKLSNLKADLDESKEIITSLSRYFEEKGNITLVGLIETVYRLEENEKFLRETIDTLNNNVKVANSNTQDLYSITSDLERRLQIIVNYLSR